MMNRRSFLAAAPLAAVPSIAPAQPDLRALVAGVMASLCPYRCGYVAVRADDLQALCEAVGVEGHRAMTP